MDANLDAVAQAAFRAGWAAACLTIAENCAKNGGADLAGFFREMANNPAPVKVGDLRTPEGRAMREGSEVVLMERIATPSAASGAPGQPADVKCPKCGGSTQFAAWHPDGSGRCFFACNDSTCGGTVWLLPPTAPASPPVGESAPAEHGMEEIERLVNTLAACSRAVGLAIGAGTHADIDERREAVARTALLDTIRAALTAAASAATKGDAT
jgi:hypothetical protein